jgi:uncharacterized protein
MKSSAEQFSADGGEQAARIAAVLDAQHVMSLATCGPEGPHAANVFYARFGFALVWVSDPASRHSHYIEADPRVAVTIAGDFSDFPEVRGLQIVGDACALAERNEAERARACLETRFPFLRSAKDGPAPLREALAKARYYRLIPRRVVLIDNRRGLGFKETVEFAAGSAQPV